MKLYQPHNLLSDNPEFSEHLSQSGHHECIIEYNDIIDDVQVAEPPFEDGVFSIINSYIKINELYANLNLLRDLMPADSKIADVLDKINGDYEMYVQDEITEPTLAASNGSALDAKESLKETYGTIVTMHQLFHNDIAYFAKSPLLQTVLPKLDEPTQGFVRDTLLPRILELDNVVAQDLSELSRFRLGAMNDTGPNTQSVAKPTDFRPMNVSSVHAASVSGPGARLAIRFSATERE